MANLFGDLSKSSSVKLDESGFSEKNLNFKKKIREAGEDRLESIDEKKEILGDQARVEDEVDRIIKEDLEKLEKRRKVREKYSESFMVKRGRKEEQKERVNLSALNMRSFQLDKEDMEKRNYMAKLMEMRGENERLKRENEEMREKEKEREKEEKEEEKEEKGEDQERGKEGEKDAKKEKTRRQKRALLKQINMSLMDIKKDLDESNLEISFLENQTEVDHEQRKKRAEERRKWARKRAQKNKMMKSFVRNVETPFDIQKYKSQFQKKTSAEEMLQEEQENSRINSSTLSTKSRFDELREKRKREMEQMEQESQKAKIVQTSANQENLELSGKMEKEETSKPTENSAQVEELERENKELQNELEEVMHKNEKLRRTVSELREIIEKIKRERTADKSFNEGRSNRR